MTAAEPAPTGPAGAGVGHRLLLPLLVLTWAASWPVIKVGVATTPPIWFGAARFSVAALILFGVLALRRQVVLPPRSDWPLVAVSGMLQMAAYSALTGFALTILPPGRASVLAYSTPIWVVPLAAWRLGERMSRLAILGVGVGLAGVLAIVAPSLRPGGHEQIFAYAMLMAAAAAWAVSIVFVRGHRFTASPLVLAPWQMLAAAAILVPLAGLVEGPPPALAPSAMAALAYVGPVGTAFAYWAVVEAGRRHRASAISMGLLATPVLGILISAVTLHEAIDPPLMAGAALVGVGIRLATATPTGRPRDAASEAPGDPGLPSRLCGAADTGEG
ncbi:MAG TPA: DMT family transporter [Phenylobacterium sp.]|nr:DMT family transporter [Phenylobacterium sp.]